jgi:hypothetical protein
MVSTASYPLPQPNVPDLSVPVGFGGGWGSDPRFQLVIVYLLIVAFVAWYTMR